MDYRYICIIIYIESERGERIIIIYIYKYMHIYIRIYVCIYVYIYMHAHTHNKHRAKTVKTCSTHTNKQTHASNQNNNKKEEYFFFYCHFPTLATTVNCQHYSQFVQSSSVRGRKSFFSFSVTNIHFKTDLRYYDNKKQSSQINKIHIYLY